MRKFALCLPVLAGLLALAPVIPAFAGASDAAEAAAARDWGTAAKLWGEVVDKQPTNRDAVLGLAKALEHAPDETLVRTARNALEDLRDAKADDADVGVALGHMTLATARYTATPQTLRGLFADALDLFTKLQKAHPKHEGVAVGLARSQWSVGEHDKALAALDAYLGKNTDTQAMAHYWKGQVFYTQAVDAFRSAGGTYPLADDTKRLFTKAQGAYMAASKADETDFDTWMQLAYASQYIGDRSQAADAYEKAISLGPNSELPVKGLSALYSHTPAKLADTLGRLCKDNPKHPWLHYYIGYGMFVSKDYAGAVKALTIAGKHSPSPAEAWFYLGQAHAAAGDAKAAEQAYTKALKANPRHAKAAWAIETPVRETGMARARQSVDMAQKVIAEYQPLLKLAPGNSGLLNNLAFILREAYVPHQKDPKWTPILEASTKYYVAASEAVGEWRPANEGMAWATRFGNAQVVSDTGLMFQFYEATLDLEKAEDYYLKALAWSDDGYFDAFNNLQSIYTKQERWVDLFDLADAAAVSLKNEDGSDHPGRSLAEQILKKLDEKGLGQ